jgi:hypothetical protein
VTRDGKSAYSALVHLRQANPGELHVISPCPSPADDLPGFLAWHRDTFSDTRMEDPPKEDPPADPPKTYTQAEVDRLTSREKDQGERAGKAQGMRDALTALGVDPDKVKVEDLKSTLEKALAADDAQKTEAQREKDAAVVEKTAAEREKTEAAREKHETRVERLLLRAGLAVDEDDDNKRDKQIARAMKLVDLEVGADSDKIRAAVDELREEMPSLFGITDDGNTSGGSGAPHSDTGKAGGSGRGGGQHGKGEFGAKGLEELKRRGYLKEPEKASA